MRQRPSTRVFLTDRQRDKIVAFLEDWLPAEAKHVYRELIRDNPKSWWQDPHFAGGVIVNHALRGNGITERAFRVHNLNRLWPDLLARAVRHVEDPFEA